MPKLITLPEAAKQLSVTESTLRDWRFRRKHLAFVKVGSAVRVLQESVDKFVERQTIPAADE